MIEFQSLLRDYRSVWLSGRPGGGKTLLAVVLAYELVACGFLTRIVANFPITFPGWRGRKCDVDPASVVDAAIILDEAWAEVGLGAEGALKRWMAYPRKNNQVFLYPSVLPLTKSLHMFRVNRVFCGTKFGLPFWTYRYRLDVGERKPLAGNFFLWTPSRYFGMYDSFAKPEGWKVYEPVAE